MPLFAEKIVENPGFLAFFAFFYSLSRPLFTHFPILVANTQKYRYIQVRSNNMAAKIKPIKPTVIKDKQIVREVIAQVRQKPTAEDVKWAKSRRKLFNELTAKCPQTAKNSQYAQGHFV